MKELNKDTALAKIKVLIDKYFEDVGREVFNDIDFERMKLIEEIDYVLKQVDIETKNLIIERLSLDNERGERTWD